MQQVMNLLDRCRYIDGLEALQKLVDEMLKNNIKSLIEALNDEELSFISLFQLRDKIRKSNIIKSLNIRNRVALDFIEEINNEGLFNERLRTPENFYNTLRWIVDTSCNEDWQRDDYDQIIDATITFLIIEYGDRNILPQAADLIFRRNKSGLYIHDLVWAFFESKDIYSLILIGSRLDSESIEDVNLAKQLLSFVPFNELISTENQDIYRGFINWLENNSNYLYFTGESFQFCSKPLVYRVNYEAKYICHIISNTSGEFLRAPNRKECELLEKFRNLEIEEKTCLADFSVTLHRKSLKLWEEWMQSPVGNQLRTARGGAI